MRVWDWDGDVYAASCCVYAAVFWRMVVCYACGDVFEDGDGSTADEV